MAISLHGACQCALPRHACTLKATRRTPRRGPRPQLSRSALFPTHAPDAFFEPPQPMVGSCPKPQAAWPWNHALLQAKARPDVVFSSDMQRYP